MLGGRNRANIGVGKESKVAKKHHQRSAELTIGVVQRTLTKSANHTHSIKVLLNMGEAGRVKNVIDE